jgi:hypothetical protein
VRGDPRIDCNRLSAAIARRAQELTKSKVADTNGQEPAQGQPAQLAAPTVPLPEAPVSITLKATLHGHEVMVTLSGVDFASVKAQVEQASQWLSVQAPPQPPAQRTTQPDQSRRQPLLPSAQDSLEALLERRAHLAQPQDRRWSLVQRPVMSTGAG